MTITSSPGGSAAGHEKTAFTVTNTSSTACTLRGYPLLQWIENGRIDSNQSVSHGPAMTIPHPPPVQLVVLSPRGHAYFYEEVASDFNSCVPAQVWLSLPSDPAHIVQSSPTMRCTTMTLTVTAISGVPQA